MKPSVFHHVPATREAMVRAIGAHFGTRFIPNPMIEVYGTLLFFGAAKTVSGGDLKRGLKKRDRGDEPVLVVGHDFTLEARDLAAREGCDVLAVSEFGWTDASYAAIRNNLHRG